MLKIFKCFCKHKAIKEVTNYGDILELGRCEKCGKHFLINKAIKQMLPLNKKEYLATAAELDIMYKFMDEIDNAKSKEVITDAKN